MRARRPSRHLDFHRLLDALQKGGCPLCRAARETSARWLHALFHEHVNDVEIRRRLRRGGAFCAKHTGQALQIGDPLGSSIIYGDLLRHALGASPVAWAPRCPICEEEAVAVRAMLDVLISHIGEEDVRTAYAASDGLCLPHLREAVERHRGPGAERLVTIERQRMAALLGECEAFVRKSDYLHQDAPTRSEGSAWKRAARKLGGGCLDGEA